MDLDVVVDRIFRLYDDHGSAGYLGESVSQNEHMIQCAMLAELEGCTQEVILAALFHDIGHLLGMQQGLTRMETGGIQLGAASHDVIGAQFLRDQGFPEGVCQLVKGHVDAKRYLVYKDAVYRSKLSEASTMTLVHQGGPMAPDEAASFEASTYFHASLRMRHWDEQGKDPTKEIHPLSKYRDMCKTYLAKIADN